jgi:undecaprenyl-diphosphatase
MPVSARLASFVQWCAQAVSRVRGWLDLTWRGLLALAAAIAALGATVMVLGGVSEDVTQHNGLATRDIANLRLFTDHRPGIVVSAARIVSQLGGVAVLALIAIAAGLLLWRRGLPIAAAVAPAFALGLAAALADLAKQVVDRGRPPVSFRLAAESEASFPSGHATNSTAMFLTLGLVMAVFVLRRPLARVAMSAATGLLVAAIGASRLVLGVHWPTDVLAGWALGATVALGVTISATLLVRFMPTDPRPPQARLRRAAVSLGRLLALERHSAKRGISLRAA